VSLQVSLFYFIAMETNPKKYRKATLIIPNAESKDQRWVIRYYATDMSGQYKMFREVDCNRIKDTAARLAYCEERLDDINKALARGPIVTAEPPERIKTNQTAKQAIESAISARIGLRDHTIKNYNDYAKNLFRFLEYIGKPDVFITLITEDLVNQFRQYLRTERKHAARTINNHIEHLRTVFKWLIKAKTIRKNPFENIDNLPVEIGRNIAYNAEEIKTLIKHMEANKPHILLLCQVMYYTLMRSNEIAHIKIENIGKYRDDQIYVPAAESKNGTARNVTIPKPLANIFLKHKIKSLPGHWYLFGNGIKPNEKFMKAKDIADRYREQVLKPLKFTTEHTLYSWKHTGVVNLYMAGQTKFAIQMQIGHLSTDSFDTYLKSLGLFENHEIKNDYPVLGVKPRLKAAKIAK
jgi:site-specific recombinase XerD